MTDPAFGTLETLPANEHLDLVAEPVAVMLPRIPDARVATIDPDLADTEKLCAAFDLPLETSVNAVVVKGVRAGVESYVVCMTPAHKRVDVNSVVRKKLGARKASFAPMDEAVELTGMEYGGITPVGVPEDWPIWVDPDAAAVDWACIGSGVRSSKLFIPGHAFLDLPNAEVVEGLAR